MKIIRKQKIYSADRNLAYRYAPKYGKEERLDRMIQKDKEAILDKFNPNSDVLAEKSDLKAFLKNPIKYLTYGRRIRTRMDPEKYGDRAISKEMVERVGKVKAASLDSPEHRKALEYEYYVDGGTKIKDSAKKTAKKAKKIVQNIYEDPKGTIAKATGKLVGSVVEDPTIPIAVGTSRGLGFALPPGLNAAYQANPVPAVSGSIIGLKNLILNPESPVKIEMPDGKTVLRPRKSVARIRGIKAKNITKNIIEHPVDSVKKGARKIKNLIKNKK